MFKSMEVRKAYKLIYHTPWLPHKAWRHGEEASDAGNGAENAVINTTTQHKAHTSTIWKAPVLRPSTNLADHDDINALQVVPCRRLGG